MIKRKILPALLNHLEKPEITLIVGPRQVGKTYLMSLIREKLENEGKNTCSFNLDLVSDLALFQSQEMVLNFLDNRFNRNQATIFIDEIQRKEDAGIFLKGLYDIKLPYKFIVSGSGSLELKEKIHESLTGRKELFELLPVSFIEFVNHKTEYQFKNIYDYLKFKPEMARLLLEEYLQFGGYPGVVNASTIVDKDKIIKEIYSSYLLRDVKELLGIEKSEAFSNLVRVLGNQIGQLVNVKELANTINVTEKTVNKYLWYMEHTYIIKRVYPFFTNVRKEITKAPIFYFYDLGLRNYVTGIFTLPALPEGSGHLFENYIYNRIISEVKYASTAVNFWRTRDNAEVDFVIRKGTEITPIEVKFNYQNNATIPRSLRSFITKYHPKSAYIIHLGKKYETKLDLTKIIYLPFFESIVTDEIF